jgi:hypothetical protein
MAKNSFHVIPYPDGGWAVKRETHHARREFLRHKKTQLIGEKRPARMELARLSYIGRTVQSEVAILMATIRIHRAMRNTN